MESLFLQLLAMARLIALAYAVRRHGRLTAFIVLATVVASSIACSPDRPAAVRRGAVGVDLSGIARNLPAWPAEVGQMARVEVERAFEEGVDELALIGIGRGLGDAAVVARAHLDIDCPNARRCEEDRQALFDSFARAAAELAANPVQEPGTGLFEAFATATDYCAGGPCWISMITDGLDSHLYGPGTVEDLLTKYARLLPDLRGAGVRMVGVGTGVARRQLALRTVAFWELALSEAGAAHVQVGRSL